MRTRVRADSIAVGQVIRYRAPMRRRRYPNYMGVTRTTKMANWVVQGVECYARARGYIKYLKIIPEHPPAGTIYGHEVWVPIHHFTPDMLYVPNERHPWTQWLAGGA